MRITSRSRIATGLTLLTLAATATASGQSPAGQASSQTRSVQSPGVTAPGRVAPGPETEGVAPRPQGEPGTATPGGAAVPGSAPPGTSTGEAAAPGTEGAPPPAATTPPPSGAANLPAAGGGAGGLDASLSSGLGGTLGGGGSYFGMLGDAPPIARAFQVGRPVGIPSPPPLPNPGAPPPPPRFPSPGRQTAVAVLPSVRGFKISENQSPQPQDRLYYSFNFYDNLNQTVNARLGSPVSNLKVYRHVFGLEKTIFDGRASVGLRLPIDSLTTTSRVPQFGGTSRAAGDLAAIFKYAVYQNPEAGRLFSMGILINTPTGPRNFAGARGIRSPHNASLQPFLGFIAAFGDLYVHGFSAVDVPTNPNDVTMMYNDLGLGYYLYRSTDLDRFITAIAPTVEVHVNTPLNHRNPYNLNDPAGTYDYVDMTFGTNIQIRRRGLLSLAIVEPVTGPLPFHLETIVQFNYRF